jgi:hypothetical protein
MTQGDFNDICDAVVKEEIDNHQNKKEDDTNTTNTIKKEVISL